MVRFLELLQVQSAKLRHKIGRVNESLTGHPLDCGSNGTGLGDFVTKASDL
jgi:hypothetical protein